jgi:hypothetical protein
MKQLSKLSFHALVLALVFTGVAAHAGGFGNNIAVRLVGTSELFIGDELFEDFGLEPKGALCYDVDLVNVRNGKIIGSATDCLTDIDAESGAPGVALTGTTFFFFRGGTVVTRGLTTVQPVLHGSPDFTHITGARRQEVQACQGNGKVVRRCQPCELSRRNYVRLRVYSQPREGASRSSSVVVAARARFGGASLERSQIREPTTALGAIRIILKLVRSNAMLSFITMHETLMLRSKSYFLIPKSYRSR